MMPLTLAWNWTNILLFTFSFPLPSFSSRLCKFNIKFYLFIYLFLWGAVLKSLGVIGVWLPFPQINSPLWQPVPSDWAPGKQCVMSERTAFFHTVTGTWSLIKVQQKSFSEEINQVKLWSHSGLCGRLMAFPVPTQMFRLSSADNFRQEPLPIRHHLCKLYLHNE